MSGQSCWRSTSPTDEHRDRHDRERGSPPRARVNERPNRSIVGRRSRAVAQAPRVASTRSSTIAIATIAMPASSASPTFEVVRGRRAPRGRGRRRATSAAITTMPSAIMIVWLTPSMIEGFASGSCTLRSICRRVEPNDVATSSDGVGHAADPEAGQADRGRQREDHRRDDRRRRRRCRTAARAAAGTRTPGSSASRRGPDAGPSRPDRCARPRSRAGCRSAARCRPTRGSARASPCSSSHSPEQPITRSRRRPAIASRQPASSPAIAAAPRPRPSQVMRVEDRRQLRRSSVLAESLIGFRK